MSGKKHGPPVLFFIRFGCSYIQTCTNTLCARFPIHGIYEGGVLGLGKEIQILEGGNWLAKHNLAVILFDCMDDATKWYNCTPDIKQPDWLSGVDMVAVEVNDGVPLPRTGDYMQLLDLEFHDYNRFMDEYCQDAEPFMKKCGASPSIASTGEVVKFRGLWDPKYLVVNKWSSEDQFFKSYDSADYQPLKQKRFDTSTSDTILFRLEPLSDKGFKKQH